MDYLTNLKQSLYVFVQDCDLYNLQSRKKQLKYWLSVESDVSKRPSTK